jgi:hypothetical protein
MGISFRKSIRLGPVRWNFGRNGHTSTTVSFGPWSWNTRTRRHRVDLPGPFSWTGKRR